MAHNEALTQRVRKALENTPEVAEKKMFRGVSFMINDKMCITTGNNELMCRIDPILHEEALNKPGCRPMLMKGRVYKGYIYVNEEVIEKTEEFEYWINLALEFNKNLTNQPKNRKQKPVDVK